MAGYLANAAGPVPFVQVLDLRIALERFGSVRVVTGPPPSRWLLGRRKDVERERIKREMVDLCQ